MGLPDLVLVDRVEVIPPARRVVVPVEVVEVGIQVPVEELPNRRADPRRRVDTVGDAEDALRENPRPGAVRRGSVELPESIRAVRLADLARRHVVLALEVVPAAPDLELSLHW